MEDNICLRIIKEKSVKRNFIPLIIALLLFVGVASASMLYYYAQNWNINLENAGTLSVTDSSGSAISNPMIFNAKSGDIYEWNWSASSSANRDINYTLSLSLNESNLETGEAKLQIFDNIGNVLSESTTAVSNKIETFVTDSTYSTNQIKTGYIRIQFLPSADQGNYSASMKLLPGTFNYR